MRCDTSNPRMRMIINIYALKYYNCDNSLSFELVEDVVEQSYP